MSAEQIREVVRIYGGFANEGISKIFDNGEFGYTRVTVERPLRLRFRITAERKQKFLAESRDLADDLAAIEAALGGAPRQDWDAVWEQVQDVLHARRARWTASEKKRFRAVFCERDPEAEPVQLDTGGFEPDPELRDFENVPLKEDIDAYFEREVKPHVPDAWMDRSKDKVGYEINFNQYFYQFKPPRSLEEIDADLKKAEEEILRLLREVTG
jgi:type I restriction enzyme M protein